MQAEAEIKHPCRVFITGRSGGGKTTAMVDLVNRVFRHQVDRVVVCCPTWSSQPTFNPIRDLVKIPRDILDLKSINELKKKRGKKKKQKDPFKDFFNSLKKQKALAALNGEETLKTLLIVDDMAGDKVQHERMGYLAQLSIQAPHFNLSIIVISQQPKLTCNGFRQNVDAAICFPPTSTNGQAWIHEELNLNLIPKEEFNYMIRTAWLGGKDDISELHSHFLFVLIKSRKPGRYFIDYNAELICSQQEKVNNKRKKEAEWEEEVKRPKKKKRLL